MRKYGRLISILCVCLLFLCAGVCVYAQGSGYFTHTVEKLRLNVKLGKATGAIVSYYMNIEKEEKPAFTEQAAIGTDYLVLSDEETSIQCAGRMMIGWNTQPDGSGDDYLPGDYIIGITDNIDLYAQWRDARTITYHANTDDEVLEEDAIAGAEAAPADESALNFAIFEIEIADGKTHELLTLKQTGFKRGGYVFVGWNTEKDGSGTSYAPGDEITITEDIDLYAQWKADTAIDDPVNNDSNNPVVPPEGDVTPPDHPGDGVEEPADNEPELSSPVNGANNIGDTPEGPPSP